jgi:hypothetical protein
LFLLSGATSLATTPGTVSLTDTIPADNGLNHDGTPANALVYRITGVSGTFSGRATQFALLVDSKTGVGNGIQAQISYDTNGDGSFDRVETYRYFATDPVVGLESYSQNTGLVSSSGSLANMTNGTIELKVWNAIGSSPSYLEVGAKTSLNQQSILVLPFTNTTTQ